MEKVPAAGYRIIGLPIAGIKRSLVLSNLAVPVKLLRSLWISNKIIKEFRPDVVIGVGGYASAAVLKVATRRRIPSVIQEQNSYPGVTNKLLANKVSSICVAYPGMEKYFPSYKLKYTGNPVRKEIIEANTKSTEGRNHFALSSDDKVLLIVGGSLGARSINLAVAEGLNDLLESGLKIIWQTGKPFYQTALTAADGKKGVQVMEFIKEMDLAYAAADIIVSRAGALAISELSIVGKPCILVPYPFAAEDHQTHNARSLSDRGAAVLIKDDEAALKLKNEILKLAADSELCESLKKNIKGLGKPEATNEIVNEIVNLIA